TPTIQLSGVAMLASSPLLTVAEPLLGARSERLEHLLDALNESDASVLDLLEIDLPLLDRRGARISPNARARRPEHRPRTGKVKRREQRSALFSRKGRVLRDRSLEANERWVDGHDCRRLSKVRVPPDFAAEIGIELISWQRVPIAKAEDGCPRRQIIKSSD